MLWSQILAFGLQAENALHDFKECCRLFIGNGFDKRIELHACREINVANQGGDAEIAL